MTTITTPAARPASVRRGKPTGWIAATIVAAVLALVGMLAAVFMAYAGPAASHDTSNSSAAVIAHHQHTAVTPAHSVSPAHPVTPKVTPSDSIKLEQEQLGRLNYYEGPINGYYTQATSNAVKYLQRDAGLPQTGQMNAATQAALTTMLATGNNHMAG